jgi:hypothetical protein
MIGSPENNFQTMQPQQQDLQPRNVMLGNAMRNAPQQQARPPLGDRSVQGYRQPSQTWQPSMLAPQQYGNPTPVMSNWQMPQSNASYGMQPQLPGSSNISYGQSPMQNTGYNTGLAKPVPPLLGQ